MARAKKATEAPTDPHDAMLARLQLSGIRDQLDSLLDQRGQFRRRLTFLRAGTLPRSWRTPLDPPQRSTDCTGRCLGQAPGGGNPVRLVSLWTTRRRTLRPDQAQASRGASRDRSRLPGTSRDARSGRARRLTVGKPWACRPRKTQAKTAGAEHGVNRRSYPPANGFLNFNQSGERPDR